MLDPNIPGIGWRIQYDRLERAFQRIKQSHGSSVEYDDDLQNFFECCLHLADWIGQDSATGMSLPDIKREMLSHQALQDAADLANASKHFARSDPARRTHVTSKSVTVHLGRNKAADISHTVTRANGTTFSAQDLVDDAWNAWQMILRGCGLIY